MLPSDLPTRRDALKRGAATALGLPLLVGRLRAGDAPTSPADRMHGIKLGVASISLRDLSVPEVIKVMHQLEVAYVSIFRSHAPFEQGSAEDCRATAQQFRAAGITPWTTSVVYLKNDEAATRRAFDNVRAAGLKLMTCSPAPDALALVERFVKKYDIRLAIHNHGPEDKEYPSPFDVMKLIDSLDPRIGLCIDVGHTMRAGVDPARAIRECAVRLYDVHLKDSRAQPGAKDIPVEVGRGGLDIRGILAALIDVNYSGTVAFEYEVDTGNPAIGLAESVGYVRGLLAAM